MTAARRGAEGAEQMVAVMETALTLTARLPPGDLFGITARHALSEVEAIRARMRRASDRATREAAA